MFLVNRGTIVALSGEVSDATDNVVSVTGMVKMPVTGAIKKKICHIKFDKSLAYMHLKKGAHVIVTARPGFDVQALLNDGMESALEEYDLKGYNIRYSGSFTFSKFRDLPEENIFSGNVENYQFTSKGWTIITLSYKSKNILKNVQLVVFYKYVPTGEEIFVTGEGSTGSKSGVVYYPVKKIGKK